MAENTKIEWCDHTFNPWVGCTKISPACDNCYAEGWAKRTGQSALWQGERRRTAPANWNLPLKWNAQAEREGRRYRVFCASLADVFDNQVPDEWRIDLWALIATTKSLDWLLLTKRPQNIAKMLPDHRVGAQPWGDGWPNVWLGTTAENQQQADLRIPHLLSVPARVHFLSCEPLLGPIDLEIAWHGESALDAECWGDCGWCESGFTPLHNCQNSKQADATYLKGRSGLDWVIAGGESGPGARPMHPDWPRGVRDQCAEANVPFFFKQWGEWIGGSDFNPNSSYSGCVPIEDDGSLTESPEAVTDSTCPMFRTGKKRAGRLLDGREHNDFPSP